MVHAQVILQILMRLRVIDHKDLYADDDRHEYQDVNDLDEIRDRVTDKLLRSFAPDQYYPLRVVWYFDADN